MAHSTLVPVFLLVLLLFAPLVAAQWALIGSIVSKTRTTSFRRDLYKAWKILDRYKKTWDYTHKDRPSFTAGYGFQAPLRYTNDGAYVVDLGIMGGMATNALVIATAHSLVWTGNCRVTATVAVPCTSEQCQNLLNTCPQPPYPSYACSYNFDGLMRGHLITGRFTSGTNPRMPTPLISYACNQVNNLYSSVPSLAGVGRGPLSLTSQLHVTKFSYCFTDYFNASITSQMFFGSYADLDEGATGVSMTPLIVPNQYSHDYYYYLNLSGMAVDGAIVQFPGGRSVLIDTLETYTYLEKEVYDWFKEEIVTSFGHNGVTVNQDHQSLLCFDEPSDVVTSTFVPSLTFYFRDAPMNFSLPNYVFRLAKQICFAVLPMADANANYSILGSFQQQNIQFIYDLQANTLYFRSFRCDQLQPRT